MAKRIVLPLSRKLYDALEREANAKLLRPHDVIIDVLTSHVKSVKVRKKRAFVAESFYTKEREIFR